MKLTPKKTKTIQVRFSEEDYRYLRVSAYLMGQSVSGMFRLLAGSAINAVKVQEKEGKINIENIESLCND
jgi:hypothetical protein